MAYQTLVAIWPSPRASRRADDLPDRAWRDAACERLTRYMLKAAREAKMRTSWVDPDAAYESALRAFVAAMLEPAEDAPFLTDVARLVARIAPIGAWISLARIAIHLTAPGTPDVYQGDELWNQTLVDPDNRRPVDYDARASALAELDAVEDRLRSGSVDAADPRLKLLVTHRLLAARRAAAELYQRGDYHPLAIRGPRARSVFAYARTHGDRQLIVIAARPAEALIRSAPAAWWADTSIELPSSLRDRHWRSQIVRGDFGRASGYIEVAAALGHLPSAVLAN
jgi:(1->4)-alpha-D-glucan 1-alpha-D-glucosylmutase